MVEDSVPPGKWICPGQYSPTEKCLSYVIRGVTICHYLPKQWSALGPASINKNDFLHSIFSIDCKKKKKTKRKGKNISNLDFTGMKKNAVKAPVVEKIKIYLMN